MMSDITQEQKALNRLQEARSWRDGMTIQEQELVLTALTERHQHIKRIEELEDVLEDIENPIAYLRREAEKDGAKLNGSAAVSLAEDASFLRGIARKALPPTKTKDNEL
jgi:hypothetical protein